MTDPHNPTRNDQLEAYLDGLLDDAERAAIDESLRTDPAGQGEVQLQGRIDASLARLFGVGPPAEQRVAAIVAPAAAGAAPSIRVAGRFWWAAAGLAAAAAMGWVLAGNPFAKPRTDGVVFAARPLSDVYREAIANGFEPAYECTEAERFADTFARRQGQPLKLLELPSGVRMLGLAYPGGLSRDTTAMLCRVDGQPVMVFVDRLAADQSNADQHCNKTVHVFRAERDGLVFYEVTPFDRARVFEFLAPPSAQGASELAAAHTAA